MTDVEVTDISLADTDIPGLRGVTEGRGGVGVCWTGRGNNRNNDNRNDDRDDADNNSSSTGNTNIENNQVVVVKVEMIMGVCDDDGDNIDGSVDK